MKTSRLEAFSDGLGRLDDQLNQLIHRFDPVKDAVDETSADVWESLQLLGSEVKDGFKRIRNSLSS